MFDYYSEDERIGIYVDYSNLYYCKYKLGWDYDLEKFIKSCLNIEKLSKLIFYGAYDPRNIPQMKRIKSLEETYTSDKVFFHIKKLEPKGTKNKGNADTEMGFDISRDLIKNIWDAIILFTGDGDFLYPVEEIVKSGKKVTIVSTKGYTGRELIKFISENDDSICRYIDIHKENSYSKPIREALRNYERGLCLSPVLINWIKETDSNNINNLKNWVEAALEGKKDTVEEPLILKENQNVRNIILGRHDSEKRELIGYLNNILQ